MQYNDYINHKIPAKPYYYPNGYAEYATDYPTIKFEANVSRSDSEITSTDLNERRDEEDEVEDLSQGSRSGSESEDEDEEDVDNNSESSRSERSSRSESKSRSLSQNRLDSRSDSRSKSRSLSRSESRSISQRDSSRSKSSSRSNNSSTSSRKHSSSSIEEIQDFQAKDLTKINRLNTILEEKEVPREEEIYTKNNSSHFYKKEREARAEVFSVLKDMDDLSLEIDNIFTNLNETLRLSRSNSVASSLSFSDHNLSQVFINEESDVIRYGGSRKYI